jgi:hypothetical protein
MNETYYINELIVEIEAKLKWNNIALWTDIDYKKFSQLINDETNISISPQTFKRLFGKVKYKQTYSPQPATKDALARFLGHDDWHAFVKSKNISKEETYQKIHPKKHNFPRMAFVIVISSVSVIIVLFITLLIRNNEQPKASFYAENVSGSSPHTVSFHYDISKLKNKDIWIDFGYKEIEDTAKYEKLDKSRKLINHCYESPGFYNVRLLYGNKVLSSLKVDVLSDGWSSYYFIDDNFALRRFVFPLENKITDQKSDGFLYISPEDINRQGFKGNAVYYLEHILYRGFEVSTDSCEFNVKYKNSPETGGISCYDVEFRIIGENGIVSVMLVQKGCYRWSEVTIGDVHLNGKYNDLTSLSSDMSSWNILKIKIKDYHAFFINGSDTIFSSTYKQPIGMIKGLRLVTKGSGEFDFVSLSDSKGQLKFEDGFD